MTRISYIIPTIGRPSLTRTLETVLPQLAPQDEAVVIGDGDCPSAKNQCLTISRKYPSSVLLYLETKERHYDWGCTPCDYGVARASGDYVVFLGDDDLASPNAVEEIRKHVDADPGVPFIFAMTHQGTHLRPDIRENAVSGQQIVVPRDMSKMPKFATYSRLNYSDQEFIEKCIHNWNAVSYADVVIAIMPQRGQQMMTTD